MTTRCLWLAALASIVLLAFSSGFANAFLEWDDTYYVTENQFVLAPTAASMRLLLRTVVAGNYHPVTMLSLLANRVLFGPGPASFIVTNTLIHVLDTLLVFALAYSLTRKSFYVAGLVALIWGLHPMHVESVMWISERKDVLSVFFFLAACLAYQRSHRAGGGRWLVATFVLFVLSCLAKATAVTLPLVLMLIDYREGRRVWSRDALLEKAPFFAVALLVGAIAVSAQGGGDFHGWLLTPGVKSAAVSKTPLSPRWFIYGCYGFLMYLWRLVVPWGLSALHPYPAAVRHPAAHFYLGIPAFAAAAALTVWGIAKARSERHRLLVFAAAFFLVTILPVLQFLPVGLAFMADRYSYIPYFGLILLVVYAADALRPSHRKWAGVAGIAFAAACFYLSTEQVKLWKNTETVWTNVLRWYPDNVKAHEFLGLYYSKVHRPEEAVTQFNAAIRGGAAESELFFNRGYRFHELNRLDEAIADYSRALERLGDTRPEILHARALALLHAKQYKRAFEDYDHYLRLRPDDVVALHNRGVSRFQLGDREGAVADFRRALALRPDFEDARRNLQQLGFATP